MYELCFLSIYAYPMTSKRQFFPQNLRFVALAAVLFAAVPTSTGGQGTAPRPDISTAALRTEVRDFMSREVAVHLAEIKSLNPPPDRVNGSITTGEYTWGSFMRAVAAQSEIGGSQIIVGKDTARPVAEMGLYEARRGGKAFSQLYAAQALRHFGSDLSKNAVWLSMNDSERKEWESLLDARRIYDPKTRQVINLPENYLGVAARIAAYAYEFGVMKDRVFLDSLIERAAVQFTDGAIYADDDLPNGRYDRYSNEYIRFCWKAAEVVGRQDILEKLKPSMKAQMRLWWDVVSDQGYGYNWGRSQGLVSYLDTLEIAAFLGENPEFRPASITEIASLYNLAWRWIRKGYLDDRHSFDLFAYGRGNYSYINIQREFQQIATSFAKIIVAHDSFMRTLAAEKIAVIPGSLGLAPVARFEFFNTARDKPEGVWLFRQGKLRFALPITVGTKPAIADYLPAPFGLAGFSAPVEEVYPSYVPFLTLADGKTYAAADGATSITPAADGRSLKFSNTKWAQIGSKSGDRFEIGLRSDVELLVKDGALVRRETVTADRDIEIKLWKFAFPSTASSSSASAENTYTLTGREGTTAVTFKVIVGTKIRIVAAGDSKLSKGVLGAIPLHLVAENANIKLKAGQKLSWEISVEPK